MNPEQHAEYVGGTFEGPVLYPHYYSTYCIHHRCQDCRLTCKTCDAPCQCSCHHTTQFDGTMGS